MIKYLLTFLSTTALYLLPTIACAQVYQPTQRTPASDNTLNTQVLGNGSNFTITGGASKGQTLFHSFSDFSVPSGGSANFLNPVGTRDIISRVTGGLFSDINGLINSSGANFFLINPNGIVFGPNAQLNVGKAFMASTANGINLVDGSGRAITFGTNLNGDAPLLSVAPNVLFNVSGLTFAGGNGQIRNFGTLENTNQNPYIGLIGGNITLDGRDGGGKINAPGGRVDLGGLSTAGTVGVDSQGLVVGGTGSSLSDVALLNGASVSVRANQDFGTVNTFVNNASSPGSSINISANNLSLINDKSSSNSTRSYLDAGIAGNSGIKTTTGGNINIKATGQVKLDNGAILNTIEAGADGKIGDITISANSLNLNNNSEIIIVISAGAKGATGDIQINTKGDLTISGTNDPALIASGTIEASQLTNSIYGTGTAGKILIDTQGDISLSNRGNIINSIDVVDTGEALVGNRQGITITNARNLSLTNNSNIQASNYSGKGTPGNISISIKGDLVMSGTANASKFKDKQNYQLASSIVSGVSGTGNAGNINISAKNISLKDLSLIQTNIYSGTGNAGNIKIVTTGDLSISGTNDPALLTGDRQSLSTIGSATAGNGTAGKIEIETRKLSLTNRGGIYNSIDQTGSGDSQLINIIATDVSLTNSSLIESANVGGKGNAGSIKIQAEGTVEIGSKSALRSGSDGTGEAANILINSDQVILNNGSIESTSVSSKGGSINLNLRDKLLMRNNALISTDSDSNGRNGSGGNITINSPLIVALPGNNDITANAYQGDGGRVNINSQGLFGIKYRPAPEKASDLTNDITASSSFGQSGVVNIKTPGTDPGKDSTELPNATTDASNQISQACSADNRQNKLTVTGRGGLPPNASEPLTSDVVWQDARGGAPRAALSRETPAKLAPPAVGWLFDGTGKVKLIAAGIEAQPTGTSVVCPK